MFQKCTTWQTHILSSISLLTPNPDTGFENCVYDGSWSLSRPMLLRVTIVLTSDTTDPPHPLLLNFMKMLSYVIYASDWVFLLHIMFI